MRNASAASCGLSRESHRQACQSLEALTAAMMATALLRAQLA
jgi:hypothetical protein